MRRNHWDQISANIKLKLKYLIMYLFFHLRSIHQTQNLRVVSLQLKWSLHDWNGFPSYSTPEKTNTLKQN